MKLDKKIKLARSITRYLQQCCEKKNCRLEVGSGRLFSTDCPKCVVDGCLLAAQKEFNLAHVGFIDGELIFSQKKHKKISDYPSITAKKNPEFCTRRDSKNVLPYRTEQVWNELLDCWETTVVSKVTEI